MTLLQLMGAAVRLSAVFMATKSQQWSSSNGAFEQHTVT